MPDLRKKVGQLFAVGFHSTEVDTEIKSMIHDYGVGAIILFKRNIQNGAQLKALTLALQQEARTAGHEQPLFIALDQENGLITRISPPMAPQQPGMMTLGAAGSAHLAYEVAKATGETLRCFGINMNYAPIGDINSEPLNPVIGTRSPGDEPEFVSSISSATARGLREEKVVPSIKHFPGHGDTAVDSHFGLPVINKSRQELEKCELVPFRRAVAEGIETVMMAHIALPGIGDDKLPASLSPTALGILRKEMKYDGVIITDCLEMDGVRATFGTVDGTVMALKAGSDSIMICHTYDVQAAAINRVCQEIEKGNFTVQRIDSSADRLKALKSKFLSWDEALSHPDENFLAGINEKNEKLSQEAYARAVTLIRSQSGILPLSTTAKTVFLSPGGNIPAGGAVDSGIDETKSRVPHTSALFGNVLREYNANVTDIRYDEDGLSSDQWKEIEDAGTVIFATRNAMESPYQHELGLEVARRALKVVHIATCAPYDFLDDQVVHTYLATYEPTIAAFTAAVKILYGKATSQGKLPVGNTSSAKDIQFKIDPFHPDDLDAIGGIWAACFQPYNLHVSQLSQLISAPGGRHLVVKDGVSVVGFVLAFVTPATPLAQQKTAHIAVLAVSPSHQNRGIGTALLARIREILRAEHQLFTFKLGSGFPRFWPGLPCDLLPNAREFFVHRGARLVREGDVDMFQDITEFEGSNIYLERAAERGFTFRPLQQDEYDACIELQKKNFGHSGGWVDAFVSLPPSQEPNSVMVAFNSTGRQIGWTLMLSPDNKLLQQQWAFPPLLGPKTGLIGCVGVDTEWRSQGIGLALISHAIQNMQARGVEKVFVDWTDKVEWYGKVGFRVWKEYIMAEI
ncbi:putative beta-N-acetylglucosaminidase [Talaromyces proteolyticus]|uniref:Beta-N-acetylglucosaminidase n=1 Tax=Talaromyces proteolyticus TaxID=1131652 RepID=A0AAD4Q3S3_9EURO|nr:putative beta-N-acetylglucosaminidase [Talaromyces proteolyticus]KAH8705354.1 putative beta-N-acetylglucosaminidase [Talaromyces proteolyticus]